MLFILKKYKELELTNKFYCQILANINNNIIWKDGKLYYYDGFIWRSGEYAELKFKSYIENELYD